MRIAIFGMGYVGSVNAACLAELGHEIICNDIKEEKVDKISKGISPVKEPGLSELIKKHAGRGLKATVSVKESVENSEIGFICVGTPLNAQDDVDLDRVQTVFNSIVSNLNKHYIIVIRSTVPPETANLLQERNKGKNVEIVLNPEFLREGEAIKDFFNPNITVVGSSNRVASEKVIDVYEKLPGKKIITDIGLAGLIKYVNNSWHALKIAFTNEVSSIASQKNIDPYELMELFCLDDKLNISKKYHKPGFAYGGSCLSKDNIALVNMAHRQGLRIPLIDAIEDSNSEHIERAIKKILQTKENNVGFLGISFKYDGSSGDPRGSPIIRLISGLIEAGYLRLFNKGYNIHIYDPYVNKDELESFLPHFKEKIEPDFEKFLKKSKVLVIGNELPELKHLPEKIREDQIVIDLLGVFEKNGPKKGKYMGVHRKS